MSKSGPILLIDDDADDQESFEEAFSRIGVTNERKYFKNPDELLHYLKTTGERPLAIISDYRLPLTKGIDLKAAIEKDETLRRKSIPFIFFTGSASPHDVDEAFVNQCR